MVLRVPPLEHWLKELGEPVPKSQVLGLLKRVEELDLVGVGAEVAARIMEKAFDYLDAPVIRVSGKDVPMPYAANLEKLALPSVAEVVDAAKAVSYR